MASTAAPPHCLNSDAHAGSNPSSLTLATKLSQSSHHAITSATYTNTPSPISSFSSSTGLSSLNFTSHYSSSNASSPAVTPLQFGIDGSRGRPTPFPLTNPVPLELGESIMAVPASTNSGASGDAFAARDKGPGLMRRISRGAANKLTRRRQSSSQNDKRDRSSGPVIMRRRSDSKTGNHTGKECALDSSYETEDLGVYDSLGVSWRGGEAMSLPSEYRMPLARHVRHAGGIAPKVDSALQRGTALTKVTRKKRKPIKFVLDLDAAKVYWDPTNPSKQVYIDDIKEIRIGADARNYREEHGVPKDAESRWFTIIFAHPERSKGRPVKIIHLIAPDDAMFELWTTTLEHISRYRIGLMAGLAGSSQSESVLQAHWQREIARFCPQGMKAGETESLDFGAVESVCRSLHINCSQNMLRAQFTKADVDGRGKLNFTEFKDFLQRLKERRDVKEIFRAIAADHQEGLTLDEFLAFLRHAQGENIDENLPHWASVFGKFVRRSKPRAQSLPEPLDSQTGRMNMDAFSAFLMSSVNGVYAPSSTEGKFDRPLNEYFISSSHNTYLLGRQVAGASSTEAYITALQQGCRCVEIDCWDGADGRPIVSHGRTMTSSVLFADCITVINRYAFVSSEYPLILSLEVHCNPEQQLAMAAIMMDTFGDQLLLEPLMTNCPILPSPEDLKRRVLVKVKTADEPEEPTSRQDSGLSAGRTGRKRSSSSPFMRSSVPESPNLTATSSLSTPPTISPLDSTGPLWSAGGRSQTTTSMSSATEDSDSAQIRASSRLDGKKRQRSRIVKGLADLGVYTRGYKWHSFASAESKRYNHVYSFAERSFESICRDPENKLQLENHNKKYLTRVYPSGFRLRSSNFDPNAFWRRGVQMVALNYQTFDVGMQMNRAMFAAGSDRTGYILKPESLRTPPMADDDKQKLERKLVRFSVNMISAQQLPRPRGLGPDESINPYIEIELFSADDKGKNLASGEGGLDASARNGMSGIGLPHRRRTKIEQSNGYNPVFNNQFKLSLETKYPDLVFVRWVVWSSSDGRSAGNNSVQLATFTAKLTSLAQGFRYLPLYDECGDQFLFSTLFCKIAREDPAPSRFDLDEVRAERRGIFRHIGQSVFRRALSTERDGIQDRERSLERQRGADGSAICSVQSSPSLAPTTSNTSAPASSL